MIHGMPGFEAVGEVISGAEAMVAADTVDPDLVLIDVHMPEMSGIEASRRLSAHHPEIVVVLISTADPSELPAAARNCGAAEVLRKQDLGPGTIRRIWAEHGRPSDLLNPPVCDPGSSCHGGRDSRDRGGARQFATVMACD